MFRDISPEQLAADESFRRWVLENNPQDALYWTGWLNRYPDQTDALNQARRLLLAMHDTFEQTTPEELREEADRFAALLDVHPPVRRMQPWKWAAAASVVLLTGLGAYWYTRQEAAPAVISYRQLLEQTPDPMVEKANTTPKPLLVMLSDGSSVILQPESRISYPRKFRSDKREIFLSGEAFFEIAKDPAHPFFVYANNLVTRVVGTSFTIRAFEQDKDVKVIVKTGRVSVFARAEEKARAVSTAPGGLILIPNQQVVFNKENSRMVRSLIQLPAFVEIPQQADFHFRRTPVADVFTTLEKAYGIRIVYDREVLRRCFLTANLSDEPLLEKLNLICQTIDARYEQLDGEILITGPGCQ
ncbi:FecR family protein [Siphonobacter aquaeclarae]|uniref:FecR family protein n=1 Tax=Siphonobacter aquaeclarae TaxID=563176 RepID=A0A1G9XMD3_9BACT|nr:FecR family protein [Siphonobacter aquaeclarae]SDM97403.1 FecR family protein [Siphonobacter aquaeclarae]